MRIDEIKEKSRGIIESKGTKDTMALQHYAVMAL